jgi:hypothetical protein
VALLDFPDVQWEERSPDRVLAVRRGHETRLVADRMIEPQSVTHFVSDHSNEVEGANERRETIRLAETVDEKLVVAVDFDTGRAD